MKTVILEELKRIEKLHDVRILLAVESGSRAWGFPSLDSDYDVRFIYIKDKTGYLKVFEKKDTIDIPVDEVLDINGWDLKKTLKLLYQSNASLFEWFSSPIVYSSDNDFVSSFYKLSSDYFRSKAVMYHYINLAKKSYGVVWEDDRVRIKKLFYVIRPLFVCMWIEKYESIPPMNLQEMMEKFSDDDRVYYIINDLIEYKSGCTEKDIIEAPTKIIEFVERKIKYYDTYVKEINQDKKIDVTRLDTFFANAVSQWSE